MQRRTYPLILLYGFGLALALSLVFNGFLLYEQSHQRSLYEDELGSTTHSVENVTWQQQLSDCRRANQQKDSLIRQLAQESDAPPGLVISNQRTATK